MRHARVGLRLLALDQPRLLGAADELGDGALGELQALGELGHRGLLAPVRRTHDHQKQEVTLRGQAGVAGDALRPAEEAPQGRAKLGDGDDVADLEARGRTHRDSILDGRPPRAKTRANTFGSSACSGPTGA